MSLPDIRKFSDLINNPNTVLTELAGGAYHLVYDPSETVETDKVKVITAADARGRFALPFLIGDGDNPITTTPAIRGWVYIPVACVVSSWELVADASGNLVIDVWRADYANFPPTNANSIAGSEKPTLASQQKNRDTALTTWSTFIPAGSYLAIEIESVATIKLATLALIFDRA
ncbi:MAG: hypothetical protein KF698_08255 [Anaerolineales bacterium]|nr:hypothetical protein [Anaerolineales bacterium]